MAKNYKQEIDLSGLPKWRNGEGLGNYNTINWKKSIGHKVSGTYDAIVFELKITGYESKKHELRIEYNEKLYEINTELLKKCKVGKILGKITKEFKIEIGTNFKDDKRDITITDREHRKEENIDKQGRKSIANRKWYKYTCNICGWTEGWIIEGSLKTSGCRCCANQIPVLGINTIWDTDEWMIPIVGEEFAKTHTYGSSTDVKNKDYYRDGISMPNKIMYNVLEQINIEFETEYSPKWIGRKRYDFYIPSLNTIIEMDGGWHYQYNNMSGQTAEESKEKDDYKDKLAREHGIEVIRVNCDYKNTIRFEYVKNNLINNDKLNELFNFNNSIDWTKVKEFALSNLAKVACDYKKNNQNMTTTEIGSIMKVNQMTIIAWLKEGNGIWCNYDPQEEIKISLEKGRNKTKEQAKPVEVLKNDISLGTYPSTSYLDEHSEEIFGIKFVRACMTNACLGKPKYLKYKGYTFKYISKEEYELRKEQENLKQVI